MKATLKQYQQSPQKVRLVADFVRGKNVNKALTELSFVPKKASSVVAKLLKSALANATENDGKDGDNLFIKEIRVDDGAIMYRMRPRARGRGMRIRKRTSHITVTLEEKAGKTTAKATETKKEKTKEDKPKTAKKTTKKPAAKTTKKKEA